MSFSHYMNVKNGDGYSVIAYYNCDKCSSEICESDRHYSDSENHFCIKCSFILGKISDKEFLEACGLCSTIFKVELLDEKAIVYTGKPPSEMSNKDYRATKQYRDWRTSVFNRDDYTCQHCMSIGGELNAHHIKLFSKYVELRYELSNGLTLCVDCHRKVHRKSR